MLVGVLVFVGVSVFVGVFVTVPVFVGGNGVFVIVGVRVMVGGSGVNVIVGVFVLVGVTVLVGVSDGVSDMVGVRLIVGVRLMVGVRVMVGVAVMVGVRVRVGVTVGVEVGRMTTVSPQPLLKVTVRPKLVLSTSLGQPPSVFKKSKLNMVSLPVKAVGPEAELHVTGDVGTSVSKVPVPKIQRLSTWLGTIDL